MTQPAATPYRIPGCESTNHTRCYGELWQCHSCGKTVCSAEGSDDRPDLCDDCWVLLQADQPHPAGESL